MAEFSGPSRGGRTHGNDGADPALLRVKPQFIMHINAARSLTVTTVEGTFTLTVAPESYSDFAEVCRKALGRPPATWVERAWPHIIRMIRP
jgi:predicted MarR family transcription regulator